MTTKNQPRKLGTLPNDKDSYYVIDPEGKIVEKFRLKTAATSFIYENNNGYFHEQLKLISKEEYNK